MIIQRLSRGAIILGLTLQQQGGPILCLGRRGTAYF